MGNSEILKNVGFNLGQSSTGNNKVNGSTLSCQPKVIKHYHHIGIGVSFRQFDIGDRKQSINIPVLANAAAKKNEVFYKAKGSAFKQANSCDINPSPLKIYENSKLGFAAEVTMGASRLIVESKVDGYQLDGATNAKLNAFLGKALALNLQRSGIIKPTGSGNFKGSYLGTPEVGLNNTEMMGLKLFVYARIKLNGKVGIYEIVDGKMNGAAIDAEYQKRKVISDNQYSDEFCGGMPLIPGVYQVHVLFESGGGAFNLLEVHCDGDPMHKS